MPTPEKKQRFTQLRADVDGVYHLLTDTNTRVREIAAKQKLHGVRLDGIDTRLNRMDGRLHRLEQGQREHSAKIDRVEVAQREQSTKIDRVEKAQLEQGAKIDALDTKMDQVLALLSHKPSGD